MKIFSIFFAILLNYTATAQKIIGAVMVDENGITQNEKKAKYLVVLKNYGDTAFERLDYSFAGPMQTSTTFKDSQLSILNGRYMEYNSSGYLHSEGNYDHNRKDGKWYIYDDTSHAVLEYKFHLDTLISTIDLDSLHKEKEKIKEDTTGQFEAVYVGGVKKIAEIIQKNIQIPDRMAALTNGGTSRVRFVVDIEGKLQNIEIQKSVEFSFDEESLRVVALLKDWMPASDKGEKVKAYRVQPITVTLQ